MRVYVGMPSFLNPLEGDRGGYMIIEVGSKWVRSKLYRSFPIPNKSYFLGQEFEVEEVTSGFVMFRGDLLPQRTLTGNLAKKKFLEHFTPINITLENK